MAKTKHRVWENHLTIYGILLLYKLSGVDKPIPNEQLVERIQQTLYYKMDKKNHNRTCRTLVKHGMLARFIHPITRKVAYTLTEKSEAYAEEGFKKLFNMTPEQYQVTQKAA